jgi:ribosomal protein S12 methylthiotransferase accessory factor
VGLQAKFQDVSPWSRHLPSPHLRRLLSGRTGLVKELLLSPTEPGDPRLVNVSTLNSDVARVLGVDGPAELRSAAVGTNRRDACNRALGEAAERYAAYVYDPAATQLGSADQLRTCGYDTVEPESFPLFAAEQYADPHFSFRPFTSDTYLRWTPGRSMLDNRVVWAPSQVVHFGYKRAEGEPLIAYPTSSGCAAGPDLPSALFGGLMEQVERDSFMIAWYARLALPHVDLNSDPAVAQFVRQAGLNDPQRQYDLLWSTTDLGIPSCFGVTRAVVGGGRRAMAGGAAHVQQNEAALKALRELAQNVPYMKFVLASDPYPDGATKTFNNFEDNLRYFCRPEKVDELDAITSSERIHKLGEEHSVGTEPDTPITGLRAGLRRLRTHGMEPLVFDLTPPDIASCGTVVTRVLVPGFAQLGVPGQPYLGSARIYEAPQAMGHRDHRLAFADLNLRPHPYP